MPLKSISDIKAMPRKQRVCEGNTGALFHCANLIRMHLPGHNSHLLTKSTKELGGHLSAVVNSSPGLSLTQQSV